MPDGSAVLMTIWRVPDKLPFSPLQEFPFALAVSCEECVTKAKTTKELPIECPCLAVDVSLEPAVHAAIG